MDRNLFLENTWHRYPPAQPHWLGVDEYLNKESVERAFVCGRLQLETDAHGKLGLVSDGRRLSFQFAEAARWMEPQGSRFDVRLLRDGDLICIHVDGERATEALLLAPSLRPYSLRSRFNSKIANQWQDFTREVRAFFHDRDFTEVLTPTLVPSPGTEPYLEPFSTHWEFGRERETFFLPTSPEFHLKKLLAAGWTRVFEFKTCFRNGEIGAHHEPEFQMLEWYRAYRDLDSIADDCAHLIATLVKQLSPASEVPRLRKTTMAELFAQAFNGFRLQPRTSHQDLFHLAVSLGLHVRASDSWDDLFFRLFLEKIEPGLGAEGPVLVRGYPPAQAALARIGPNGFADRFEIYWRGMELANAFHELNDPAENESRFRADARRKRELGRTEVPIDLELIEALHHGLPPSGGIALGLERLFMAIFGVEKIRDTRGFPMRNRG